MSLPSVGSLFKVKVFKVKRSTVVTCCKVLKTSVIKKVGILFSQGISFADEKGTLSNWSTSLTMAGVQEINTMSKGKCLLWTTKMKATRAYPVVGLYIKTPPNE